MTCKMLSVRTLAGVVFSLFAFLPNNLVRLAPLAFAEDAAATPNCVSVGGVLFTNIGAIAGETNLGPVYGDLAGSVAATILGQNKNGTYNIQHYWVTASGDNITMKVAVLTPTYPEPTNMAIVAVPWGNYKSTISGGTGKYAGATGSLDYFGIADFTKNTLVLRYSGQVCYAQ